MPLFRIFLAALALVLAGDAPAQERIAVTEMPPYATRQEDGRWTGPALDLLREAAERAEIEYELVAASGAETEAGTAFPVFAAPGTPPAETRSLPFHVDAVGLIGASGSNGFMRGLMGLFNLDFLKVVGVVALLVLLAGSIFWLVERGRNEGLGTDGSRIGGIGNGFWWASVTATTIGYGDLTPKTSAGRMVAVIWMLFSMALTAILTAYLVSLTGGPGAGTSLADAAAGKRIGIVEAGPVLRTDVAGARSVTAYRSLAAALRALDEQSIDAIAYPYLPARQAAGTRPVQKTGGSIVLPVFRVASPALRTEIDRIVLTPQWQQRMADSFSDR